MYNDAQIPTLAATGVIGTAYLGWFVLAGTALLIVGLLVARRFSRDSRHKTMKIGKQHAAPSR